jgi:hypothetical protein
VCTFDSVNHLTTTCGLIDAFACAADALVSDGLFVFDANTDEAYASEWGKSSAIVDGDAAVFVRGAYDPASRLGRTDITTFRQADGWSRCDVHLVQRCYSDDELRSALAAAGFDRIESYSAAEAGMTGDIAVGRRFYRCMPADARRAAPHIRQRSQTSPKNLMV